MDQSCFKKNHLNLSFLWFLSLLDIAQKPTEYDSQEAQKKRDHNSQEDQKKRDEASVEAQRQREWASNEARKQRDWQDQKDCQKMYDSSWNLFKKPSKQTITEKQNTKDTITFKL